jgi:manganese/iron transport system substrate-binding protein
MASQLGQQRWLWSAIALLSLLLESCMPTAEEAVSTANDTPTVVTTSTLLADWATQVGGDEINVVGLLAPGADPHVYEPVPADSRAFEEADLIFYNGYNLEPGLIRLMNSAGVDARKVAVGEVVQPLQMEYESRKVPDPHVWGNAENAIAMVETIRDELIELSPDDRAVFEANTAAYVTELEQLHAWVGEQIATIPPNQRQLITTHDAFQYYAQTYGLEVPGTLIGISTEEQPSAQTVQRLVESVKAARVPAIFAETTINPRLIATVAEEAGVQLAEQELYSDSLGAAGSEAETYVEMMVFNTQSIVENLGGQVQPFAP